MLLTISMAAHGLQHFKSFKTIQKSHRSEDVSPHIKTMEQNASQKKLTMNAGFTAASALWAPVGWGEIKTTIIQPNAHNPIGKHIANLSRNSGYFLNTESEVLFPPNTEFKYKKIDDTHWEAEPVRSAEPNNSKYIHSFSNEELVKIFLDKVKIKINILFAYLKRLLTRDEPNLVKRFFHLSSNSAQIDFINNLVDKMTELDIRADFQIEKIDLMIQFIANRLAKNQELKDRSFWKKPCEHTHKTLLAIQETMLTIRNELDVLPFPGSKVTFRYNRG